MLSSSSRREVVLWWVDAILRCGALRYNIGFTGFFVDRVGNCSSCELGRLSQYAAWLVEVDGGRRRDIRALYPGKWGSLQ